MNLGVQEIANNPDIKTKEDYDKWIKENGIESKTSEDGYCTEDAMEAQEQVRKDLSNKKDDTKEEEDVASVPHID